MAKPKFDEDEEFSSKPKGKSRRDDDEDEKPKTQARKPIENEEELDCEFGNPELERKKDPMPRIRPAEKGKAVRFALLPFCKPKKALTHYIDKKGTFRCLSTDEGEGVCCQQLTGDAQRSDLKIVALAVKYTNCDPKTGKYEGKYKTGETEWEIGHVSLSRSNYTQINRMVEDVEEEEGEAPKAPETVFDFDIIMTHNETTGIGYTLTRASRSPRWKKVADEVKEAAAPLLDGKLLTSRLGRKLNVPEWKALISSLSGEGDDDGDNDDL